MARSAKLLTIGRNEPAGVQCRVSIYLSALGLRMDYVSSQIDNVNVAERRGGCGEGRINLERPTTPNPQPNLHAWSSGES